MEIKYGKRIKTTTFINGDAREEPERIILRDMVTSDAEELAYFIRFQKESKGSKEASFKRELSKSASGNTNRYVVREWEV